MSAQGATAYAHHACADCKPRRKGAGQFRATTHLDATSCTIGTLAATSPHRCDREATTVQATEACSKVRP
eukprot:8773701-Alexandrium_andersonii.AAC.1